MSSGVCLQVINPSALRIVSRTDLGDFRTAAGMCVTGQWLVMAGGDDPNHTLSVYRLPGVELVDQVLLSYTSFYTISYPRANSAGVVYVPGFAKITMFLISDTGNITVLGDLTAGGQLWGILSVAVGPQPGQLCVGQWDPPRLFIINIATDSIIHTLEIPAGVERVWSVAAVANGQILMVPGGANSILYLYRSVYQPSAAEQTVPWQHVVMLGRNNQFVVGEWSGRRLSVGDDEGNWHSVDALTDTDRLEDIAVWGECVLYLLDISGHLVMLCPQ